RFHGNDSLVKGAPLGSEDVRTSAARGAQGRRNLPLRPDGNSRRHTPDGPPRRCVQTVHPDGASRRRHPREEREPTGPTAAHLPATPPDSSSLAPTARPASPRADLARASLPSKALRKPAPRPRWRLAARVLAAPTAAAAQKRPASTRIRHPSVKVRPSADSKSL